MDATPSVRETRERIVREHMESENRHEFDVTLATFHHPRYEIVPTGDVFDGEQEVARYYAETRAAFPDQRNRLVALHHADDAVIVEFDLLGTPPNGRRGTAEVAGQAVVARRSTPSSSAQFPTSTSRAAPISSSWSARSSSGSSMLRWLAA